MREDQSGKIVFENLNEVPVTNIEDIFALMEMGQMYRKVGETNMNDRSSRSHTIFRYTHCILWTLSIPYVNQHIFKARC